MFAGPRRRGIAAVGVVLASACALTLLAGWRHHARWIADTAADEWTAFDSFLQMLAAPGWLLGVRVFGADALRSIPAVAAIYGVTYTGIGMSLLIAGIGWRRVLRRPQTSDTSDDVHPGRRAFLMRAPEAAFAVGIGSVGYSTLVGPWSLRIAREEIAIRGLDGAYDGIRALQLSDLHLGPRISAGFIEDVVRRALSLRPDLVLLTGDYIHNFPEQADQVAELLRPLVESTPAVGVLGNHDWYGGGWPVREALERIGVRMVDNDRCWLSAAGELSNDGGLCIAGVGDLYEDAVDIDSALRGVDPSTPRLVLSHNPDVAEMPEIALHRIDLMLSGHTHGGQIRLPFVGAPGVPSRYGQKYAQGLVHGPCCSVYVSAGVGMSIAPVRFGVPPEINLLTLRSV